MLINGHRYLTGDPNAIPANMVERIEVLTDGASSVYGSDAVAGVVNFILRSDYQGAEFSVNYGISDKDDGESKGYQFTFGQSSDKGSIMAGISYNKTDRVLVGPPRFLEELGVAVRHGRHAAARATSAVRRLRRTATSRFPMRSPICSRTCTTGFLARNPGTSGQNIATDYHCYVNNGPRPTRATSTTSRRST